MVPVEARGMTCWADSCRHLGRDVVMLSLFGNRNAVRACWATFFNKKRWPGLEVGHDHVYRAEDTAYTTLQAPMGKGLLHLILLQAHATRQVSAFTNSFYQLGPNPESKFFDLLSRRCPVPMRQEWSQDIWALGLQHAAIQAVPGFGLSAHSIQTTSDVWAPIIKQGLLDGRIK